MKNNEYMEICTPEVKKDKDSFFKTDNIDILNVYINLYNNGHNVEFLRENNKTLKFVDKSDDGNSGYRFMENTIEIPDGIYKETITHELLHCATTIIDGHAAHVGLMYADFASGEILGVCLNEGMTATKDIELFGEYTDGKLEHEEDVYPFAKRVIDLLEYVIPKDVLDTAYFEADLGAVISYLDKIHHDLNKVVDFIRDLDYVFIYLDMKNEGIPDEIKENFIIAWNNVQDFLAESLYICLNRYYEEGMIDKDELVEYLGEVKGILGACVVIGDEEITKSRIKEYKKIEEKYKKRKNA